MAQLGSQACTYIQINVFDVGPPIGPLIAGFGPLFGPLIASARSLIASGRLEQPLPIRSRPKNKNTRSHTTVKRQLACGEGASVAC